MKTYKQPEILKLSKKEIETNLINHSFEFTIEPKNEEIILKQFKGKIVEFDFIEDNSLPVSLIIELESKKEKIEVSLINLTEIKYVC